MWINEHRRATDRRGLGYPSDPSDATRFEAPPKRRIVALYVAVTN